MIFQNKQSANLLTEHNSGNASDNLSSFKNVLINERKIPQYELPQNLANTGEDKMMNLSSIEHELLMEEYVTEPLSNMLKNETAVNHLDIDQEHANVEIASMF